MITIADAVMTTIMNMGTIAVVDTIIPTSMIIITSTATAVVADTSTDQ